MNKFQLFIPGVGHREVSGAGGLGIGVFPDSRDPDRFIEEIGTGAPSRGSVEERGRPGALRRALDAAGLKVAIASGGPPELADPITRAFAAGPGSVPRVTWEEAMAANIAIAAPTTTAEWTDLLTRDGPRLVLGVGDRTPVLVEVCFQFQHCGRANQPGLLVGGITRRPGLVTPYDLSATVLDLLRIPRPSGFIGKPLESDPELFVSIGIGVGPTPLNNLEVLAARLERDASYPPAVGATTVTLCILALWAALLLQRLRRRELALRMAQAAAIVVPGWIVSQAVPSGRSELRLAVVAGAMVLAAISKPKNPMRTFGLIGVSVALAFAVVASIAPLRPGGEPGLSIWGNPLISWRFFGLANVPAVAIAAGIVVWGVMAGMQPVPLAVTSAAVAVIIGAPTMGANFVGVLTFVFGAAASVQALARKRFELWQLIVSGVLAVGAFVGALAADAGTPVSHGGRAARSIADGGVSALLDIVGDRLRLNLDLIRDFGGGVIWAPAMLLIILALVAWGLRVSSGPVFGRAAVLGGALMALASLVLEDSGFYSGGVLMVSAAAAWCLVRLRPQASDPLDGAG